jgi:hypothetical protein
MAGLETDNNSAERALRGLDHFGTGAGVSSRVPHSKCRSVFGLRQLDLRLHCLYLSARDQIPLR